MFRFTIRDVLWLMVVVTVGLAAFVAYNNSQAENTRLQTMLDSQEETIAALTKSVQLLNSPNE